MTVLSGMPIRSNLDSASIAYPEIETPLPSFGWAYKEEFPKFPDTITVKPFSWETQGILTTNKTGLDKLKLIAAMITVGLPEGFPIDKLLITDQYFCLALARALTYGETYTFPAACDACGHVEKIAITIPNQLPVKKWEFASHAAFEKGMTITLPVCKDVIALKFPTVKDDHDILKLNRATRAAQKLEDDGEFALINRVALHIKTVNKSTPDSLAEAAAYVRRIKGKDTTFLQEAIEDKNCGIRYEWKVSCDKCANEFEVRIPLQAHFFRRE